MAHTFRQMAIQSVAPLRDRAKVVVQRDRLCQWTAGSLGDRFFMVSPGGLFKMKENVSFVARKDLTVLFTERTISLVSQPWWGCPVAERLQKTQSCSAIWIDYATVAGCPSFETSKMPKETRMETGFRISRISAVELLQASWFGALGHGRVVWEGKGRNDPSGRAVEPAAARSIS